jgi:hypothetical protein
MTRQLDSAVRRSSGTCEVSHVFNSEAGRHVLRIDRADDRVLVDAALLESARHACAGDAASFDGEVLTVRASNGTVRYRVDGRVGDAYHAERLPD